MRYRERSSKYTQMGLDFGDGYPEYWQLGKSWSSILDQNNGRRRPLSPCDSANVSIEPQDWARTDGRGRDFVNIPLPVFSQYVRGLCQVQMDANYASMQRKISKTVNKQLGEFSSLNFLYELREIGDLFKKIPRPRELDRLKDLRPIDYYFAIAPTINDIRNALGSYDNAVKSINDKLKKFKAYPVSWTRPTTITKTAIGGFTVGASYNIDSTSRLTSRLRGDVILDIPIFAQAAPQLYAVLDSLSVDISASNAWNALPWSWFVDWFLPVGNALEGLPSVLRPQTRFVGTTSHTIYSFGNFTTTGYVTGSRGPGIPCGRVYSKDYIRDAFNGAGSLTTKWSFGSINRPEQVAILRDIMFPVKSKYS